ncbi:MAG TPA: hypothetical protein VJ161_05595 [Geobacteraceae bacterium]|nr:hypothetical protein [Geobacteraceae bacterium]
MNDLNVNSYDLYDAQQLLSALLPKQKSVLQEKQPQSAVRKYLDLSAVDTTSQPLIKNIDKENIENKTVEYDAGLRTFDSWESIIVWCMSLSRAEAGFVVDSQGFVIASRGRLPNQGVEGTGAELVCSIEQLERIDPEAGKLLSVEMDFDKKRLLGFVASTGEGNCYVVGLISPESVSLSGKQAIIQQIIHNLPNLD